MTSFRILGPVEVWAGDRQLSLGGPRQLALLAFLLLHPNRSVSSDAVIDAVWGPDRPGASKRLQVSIARLRKMLEPLENDGEPLLRTVGGGYLLSLGADQLDADVFEARVQEGRYLLDAGDPSRAVGLLSAALELWRGPPLASVSFEDFAQLEIGRLEEVRLAALEARFDAHLRLGRHPGVVGELGTLVAEHPTREHLAGQLMVALYRCGRQAEALNTYQRIRAHLNRELGLEPGPALRALQLQILEQAPELDAQRSVEPQDRPDGSRSSDPQQAIRGAPRTAEQSPPQSERDRHPLPPRLSGVPTSAYVGRVAEFELLKNCWDAVRAGVRHGLLVSGEPGIGKTQFTTRAAQEFHVSGGLVLFGHCSQELAAPYGAWIQALSPFVEHASDELLTAYVARHGGELSRVVPGLVRRLSRCPPPRQTDPESERYLLFSAVVGLLEHASEVAPTVLLLEDLHWGDRTTVALLKHVLAETSQLRMLLLGTYRDSDLERDHPLTGMLADLRREERITRLELPGLSEEEILSLMEVVASRKTNANGTALAREIAAKTGGNPFFVAEIIRHLCDGGALVEAADERGGMTPQLDRLGLPQSVREVVLQRVERLGEDCRRALCHASVIGSHFDVELLAHILRQDVDELLDLLEAAVEACIVEELSKPSGFFSFAHDLINQTLYEGLGTARRARMHHRVAIALEEIDADHDQHLAELALHWRLASGQPGKAAEYALRAGQRALESLAPAEAARFFSHAIEHISDVHSVGHCKALIGLGEAQRQTGDGAYRQTLLQASRIASRVENPDFAASAALANNLGSYSVIGDVDAERLQAIDRAIELDNPSLPTRRARLLALKAQELAWDPDVDRRRALAGEAVALARKTNDSRTLGVVLRNAFFACWSTETLGLRVNLARELIESATDAQDPALMFWAQVVQFNVSLESAKLERAEAALDNIELAARELGQPILSWISTYNLAGWLLPRGQIKAAEQLAERAWQLGQEARDPNAILVYGSQLSYLRIYQGRGDEVIAMLEQSVAAYPRIPAWRAGLAMAYCLIGRRSEAAAIVEQAAVEGYEHIPRDQSRATALALYADAASQVKVPGAAATLYELIEPWNDQVIWTGAAIYGHARMWLASLAAALGWQERADQLFAFACEFQEANGLLLWAAYANLRWAEALANTGDAARSRDKAARALQLAREHGYGAIESRASAIVAGRELALGSRARNGPAHSS